MKPKTKTINILHLDGGVGDQIAALTVTNYIIKRYPWITPLVWVPDFLVDFAKNVLPEDTFVKGFTEMRGQYDPTKSTKTTKWDGNTSAMKIHLVDYAFHKLCDENPSITEKNYLRVDFSSNIYKYDHFEKYVVFTTGFTADVREFTPKTVNTLASYVKSKGYGAVFLGSTQTKTGSSFVIKGKFKEEIDYSQGINLIDKTSLLDAAYIMQNSKAVLGIDNGLMHVAGCTDAKIVGGFTTVSPEIRNPIRYNQLGWNCYNVVPDESLSCKFCQQTTNFLYGHDYRNCWYKEKKERSTISCVDQMTADKFIAHLEKIL